MRTFEIGLVATFKGRCEAGHLLPIVQSVISGCLVTSGWQFISPEYCRLWPKHSSVRSSGKSSVTSEQNFGSPTISKRSTFSRSYPRGVRNKNSVLHKSSARWRSVEQHYE
ncbi:hypothetical protein EJ06DRAFT_424108 [Trichodelitschia bisporula]|uniref:Uncharacterized protein n=1 Tax=Trichodelitschia bisporula TaxID=703511 RepID=A0A6G1HWN3_9PEZI|nr:hypothetical protein EJ06DRAFT_424108 [Trichodelitschia bisporula]